MRRGGSSREQALSTYAIFTCATVGRFAQMPISSLFGADKMPPPSAAAAPGLASWRSTVQYRVGVVYVRVSCYAMPSLEESWRTKEAENGCERHGLERISNPLLALVPMSPTA